MATLARISALKTAIGQGTDNSSRIFDNEYQIPAYAATLTIIPTKSSTVVNVGLLTGAMTVNVGVGSATTSPYVGDKMKFLFTSTAGATVTLGTGLLVTAATVVIPALKTANLTFIFNGAAWVEEARAITV